MRAVYQEEGLKPNYYALYLSIKRKISVSRACSLMGLSSCDNNRKRHTNVDVKEDEILEMIEMKKAGKQWKEIGMKFNLGPKQCFYQVKQYMGDGWKNRPW